MKKAVFQYRTARGDGKVIKYFHICTENDRFLSQNGNEMMFPGTSKMWYPGEEPQAKAFAEKYGWTIVEPDAETEVN